MFKLVIIGLAVALTKQQSFFGRLKQGQSLFNSKKSPPPSLPQSFEFEYYEVTTITYANDTNVHSDTGKKNKVRYSLPLKMISYTEEDKTDPQITGTMVFDGKTGKSIIFEQNGSQTSCETSNRPS
jgi:hypothetical protein